jgi:hypothetical protein
VPEGDDAARRPAQHRVAAAEGPGRGEAAARLHHEEGAPRQRLGEGGEVAIQERRQVGVGHGGLGTAQEPDLGIHLVRHRDVRHPGRPQVRSEGALEVGGAPPVEHHHGGGGRVDGRRVGRGEDGPVGGRARTGGDDRRGQRGRLPDGQGEELGPRLVPDLEEVLEALRDHQGRGRTAALEERVGGHRRAEADLAGRDRRGGRQLEEATDAFEGRPVGGEHLGHPELAGPKADAVGEGPPAVDPEAPHAERRSSADVEA